MLKMVDGTGIIGVDMICPLGVSAPQPPNYDRVELEGAGMLVLPNSLDAPLERLELGGKTEQVQTTGAQLLKPKDGSYTVFGVSVDIANGEIKLSGTATSSGGRTIRLSEPFLLKAGTYSSEVDGKIDFILSKNSDNSYLVNLAVKNFNVNEDTEVYVGLNVMAQNTYNNKYHIMLNSGNIALPYEPYTGGKPSPSQEYQQEIKSVGKWNEGTQKYEVSVKVTGKNLFDKCLLEGGEIVEFNGVECYKYKDDSNNFKYKGKFKNGQQYALTTRILRPESKKSYGTYIKFKYEDGTDSVLYVEHGGLKTLVSNIGKTIDSIIGNYNYATDCYLDLSVTRLSRGGQDAGYDPYKEQTLTLTSDRPITKWDRLVEQGGEIGWLYGTEKYVVTGKENFSYGSKNYYTGSRVDMFFEIRDATGNEAIMRDLSFVPSIWHLTDKEGFCINGKQLHIGLYNTRIGVSDGAAKEEKIKAYKEFMAKRYADGNPFEVYYKTTETEFVPLPQSEQNTIRALKTYYPTTVITADGGELDPDIKVTYRKEI